MSTIHNEAKKGDIADIVLMPGDPLRAKYIAENFLEDVICFNQIRGMYGYTGTYKGKRISVMGHGMGIPSAGIYCYELYKFYDVKKIIRIGSCGAYDESLDILDTILVDRAYSFSNFASEFCMSDTHICSSSKELTDMIADTAAEKNIKIVRGTVLTAEVFDNYIECDKKLIHRVPKEINCIAEEMESFALFIIAEKLHKEAACLLTVTDSMYKTQIVSAENRQVALKDMIILALDTAIK